MLQRFEGSVCEGKDTRELSAPKKSRGWDAQNLRDYNESNPRKDRMGQLIPKMLGTGQLIFEGADTPKIKGLPKVLGTGHLELKGQP